MADLEPASFISLIEDELILIDDAKLSQNIGKYILIYSDKPQSIQYWYIRRHVLMYQLRRAVELVDTQTGPDRVASSQKFRALRLMLQDTLAEILIVDPSANVPAVEFSNPTSNNPLDNSCGFFDIQAWPGCDTGFWECPIKLPLG